ncbi:hypothetical protein B5X24_HaOG217065 [Helicoverpa armigera]|uniref:Uncharacterized protein n=1 Tax=Helicoverpa armigera TaxID=29058 RepID=A0A2W1BX05_HELAM|nr:hypothetical protein B5X24_HaOG217065 [Helicoverpa armigera]
MHSLLVPLFQCPTLRSIQDDSLSRHASNLLWTSGPLSPTRTMSSAKSIHQGASSRISAVSASITSRKRYGLRADP